MGVLGYESGKGARGKGKGMSATLEERPPAANLRSIPPAGGFEERSSQGAKIRRGGSDARCKTPDAGLWGVVRT